MDRKDAIFIDKDILWVKGAINSAIYDVRKKYAVIYWMDNKATNAMAELLKGVSNNHTEILRRKLQELDFKLPVSSIDKYIHYAKYRCIPKSIKIDFSWIEVTNKCNLKCIHCYGLFEPKNSNFISISDYEYILKELSSIKCSNIQIIGGEPFLHPRILELLDLTYKHGFSCEIFTNGIFINDRILEHIKRYSFKLALSYYGNRAATVKITGSSIFWDKINSLIDRLKEYNINFRLALILTSYNHNANLPDGVKGRNDVIRITGRANLNLLNKDLLKRKLITKETFKKRILSDKIKENITRHNCFGKKIYIDSQLKVYPCVMERRICYGSLKKEPLSSLLIRNEGWLKLTKDHIKVCSQCEFRYACFDCRPDSISTDPTEKPWYCTYDPLSGKWMSEEEFSDHMLNPHREHSPFQVRNIDPP